MFDSFGCLGCPFYDPDYECLASSAMVCLSTFVIPEQLEEVLTDA